MKRRALRVTCMLALGIACSGLIALLSVRSNSSYESTPLVTSTGQRFIPCSINDHGRIAGLVKKPQDRFDLVLSGGNKEVQDVACPDGCTFVVPVAINNACQVAGTIRDTNDVCHAFLWDPQSGLQTLDALSNSHSGVEAINNHGHAVGYSQTSSGSNHAVLWGQGAKLTDLGTFGGTRCYASSINDSGQVVGVSYAASGRLRAFYWDPNVGMTEIGPATWAGSNAIHINNNGLVVGRFGSRTDSMLISTWSVDKGIEALPSLAGTDAVPIALNDAGQFLFHVRSNSWMGLGYRDDKYLWTPDHGFTHLARFSGRLRSLSFILTDMNNLGQIVGWSTAQRIQESSFLLTPIAERND